MRAKRVSEGAGKGSEGQENLTGLHDSQNSLGLSGAKEGLQGAWEGIKGI